ncbi:MAG: alpha-L-rhamnosidase N-terminal domain-containing protein, partial [Steroidobacteraceae bacterium]
MTKIDRRRLLFGTSLLAAAPPLLRTASAAAHEDVPADQATLVVRQLWTERVDGPLGVEVSRPGLSWSVTSEGRGAQQSAYRVTAASTRERLEAGTADLWDSGQVASDRCFEVAYDGKVLHSGERVWWRVQVWDGAGRASAASAATWFEMGLLEPADWQGQWLDIEDPQEQADREAGVQWIWSDAIRLAPGQQQFRYRLELREPAAAAELFLTAKDHLLGVWIDGKAATLPPVARLYWGTMLRFALPAEAGAHVIAVQAKPDVGGFMPSTGAGVVALVKMRDARGAIRRLTTGEDWLASSEAPPGWQGLEFDDASWAHARAVTVPCDPRPPRAAQWARREFNVAKPLARARLYATALGAYEVYINSQRLGTARLAPEISVATDHVLYQCHDATPLLEQGSNEIAALIGDGWYASAFGWNDERYSLGDSPRRFLAQLVLDYADGSRELIATDASWRLAASAVRSSEIYNGEDYDARTEDCACVESGQHVAASPWRPAAIGAAPATRLVA